MSHELGGVPMEELELIESEIKLLRERQVEQREDLQRLAAGIVEVRTRVTVQIWTMLLLGAGLVTLLLW